MARRRAIRELEELPAEFLEVPRDISSPTAIGDFFLGAQYAMPGGAAARPARGRRERGRVDR